MTQNSWNSDVPVAISDGGTNATTNTAAANNIVSGASLTTATVAATDKVLIQDTSDSDNLKTVTALSIANLSGGSGGSRVFIASASASSSATIDFDNEIDGTYDVYIMEYSSVVPATNGVFFWLRFGTGITPTYHSGASDYTWAAEPGSDDTADAQILMQNNASSANNTSGRHFSGFFRIAGAQTAGRRATVYGQSAYDSSGVMKIDAYSGAYTSTTAVTSVQILASTGNITSGEFRLYGISNS